MGAFWGYAQKAPHRGLVETSLPRAVEAQVFPKLGSTPPPA